MPGLPAGEVGGPEAAGFPSSAVAPPNKISLGPKYAGVPSSPTAGTAVSVCPHLGPEPSSFFSIIAFTTVYIGAHRGPNICGGGLLGGGEFDGAGSVTVPSAASLSMGEVEGESGLFAGS